MSQEKAEIFECPICHLHYKSEETAKKCEQYCSKNGQFSLEIAKQAVEYNHGEGETVDES